MNISGKEVLLSFNVVMLSAPVFESEACDSFKFSCVVCDDNQPTTAGMTGNHLVKWSHRTSLTG